MREGNRWMLAAGAGAWGCRGNVGGSQGAKKGREGDVCPSRKKWGQACGVKPAVNGTWCGMARGGIERSEDWLSSRIESGVARVGRRRGRGSRMTLIGAHARRVVFWMAW